MEDLTGRQLGQYRIIEPLGEGGMAAVYKAYQPSVDRYVALKILPRHYASDPDFVHRFKQEAKIIARLEHPNILPVHDYGESDGYTYIVMRYVEGGTLADHLLGTPLPLSQISHIFAQVSSALDYAHSNGVIHRDVKPSNVLIDSHGNCLLSDFGISRMIEATGQFTVTGAFIGTPTYASPEQALGQNLDGRSDIYSLGVVLYEMTTGRPPFQAETPMAILMKHVHDPLPPPRSINPALSEEMERVILKALSKNPDDRFQMAGELAKTLITLMSSEALPLETEIKEMIAPLTEIEPSISDSAQRPIPKFWNLPVWGWGLIGVIILSLAIGLYIGESSLLSSLKGKRETAASITPALPTATTFEVPTKHTNDTPGVIMPTPIASMPIPTETLLVLVETPTSNGKLLSNWTQVQSFPAPGNEPTGIVRIGDHLWVSVPCSDRFYRLNLDGDILAELEMPKSGCGPRNVGLIWDGTSLWGTWWETVVQIDPDTGQALSEFEVDFDVRSLAWDGSLLWVVDLLGNLSAYDRDGHRERRLGIPAFGTVSAITWVNGEFWMLNGFGEVTRFDSDFLELETFSLETACGASSFHKGTTFGLFWDGESLWIADSVKNRIFQCAPGE